MSDQETPGATPVAAIGRPETIEANEDIPVTQADIDNVLNDPTMTLEERQERLRQLAEALGGSGVSDDDAPASPLDAQIGEALAMLAEGGHSYGGPASPQGEDEGEDAPVAGDIPRR